MTETTKINADLTPDPRNPNRMTPEDREGLKRALAEFGDLSGIIWNRRTGLLVAGHQRMSVLGQIKPEKTLVLQTPDQTGTVATGYIEADGRRYSYREVEWDEARAHQAMLAANRWGRRGHDDQEVLVGLLEDLQTAGLDIDLTGYDADDLTDILGSDDTPETSAQPHIDKAEELQAKWKTEVGQIWQVGQHRIACGSATDPETWERLMQGRKACLCNTDPPYGVSWHGVDGSKQWTIIHNDTKTEDDLLSNLLVPAFRLAMQHTEPDAAFYIWHASSTRRDFEAALDRVGLTEKQYIIWVKDHMVLGHADYHWQQEPSFYACKAGESCRWLGDRTQRTVWRIRPPAPADLAASIANGMRLSDGTGNTIYIASTAPKNRKTRLIRLNEGESFAIATENQTDAWQATLDPNNTRLHPTQKPVALFRIPIINHTKPGDLIIEPFSGGGGQFLAAQETGRVCYGMDLDAKYVAVTLERMAEAGIVGTLEAKP